MPRVTVNGIDINYRLEGDGPASIVMVNGLADDLETWAFQTEDFLAAGYRVLTFDNRGVGLSTMPPGPYTTKLFAEDTKALVDALGLRDFHLLGTSMGGMIAQEYAIANSADLKSLVLSSTYAAPGPFCGRMFAMWADLAPVLGVPFVMRDVTLWAFTLPFFEQREDELREFEASMAAGTQPLDAYLAQLSSIRTHDTADRLDRIAAPTLVIAGEEDILIPVVLSRRLHEGIAGSEWATTPGGHASIWEHPKPFNRAVLDFLARHN
ncbi:MAG TPA: alpha/beta hydrolase [Candidatus Limnocylindrales bacterium]|nr:alpha/beta hydrolase [Candidatus Limnocylindrales bacterium]